MYRKARNAVSDIWSDRAPAKRLRLGNGLQAAPQVGRRLAMARQAEGTQIIQIALPASLSNRPDVIRVPERSASGLGSSRTWQAPVCGLHRASAAAHAGPQWCLSRRARTLHYPGPRPGRACTPDRNEASTDAHRKPSRRCGGEAREFQADTIGTAGGHGDRERQPPRTAFALQFRQECAAAIHGVRDARPSCIEPRSRRLPLPSILAEPPAFSRASSPSARPWPSAKACRSCPSR